MLYLFWIFSEFSNLLCQGIFLFVKPEIVAKANIPKRAIPKNNPAP